MASTTEARRVASDRVEAGTANQSALLDAEAAMSGAQADLLRAEYDRSVAAADLARLEGAGKQGDAPMTPPQLTYTGVLLAVLANQLCLPVPAIVFLMAAGALSAHGYMHASTVVLLSVLPCLAADGIWFWLGRKWGSQVSADTVPPYTRPRTCSSDAHHKFGRYGLPLLCVAKFVPGLDGLMPPLAGAEGVSLTGFFALDAVGSFLWSGFYVGVGYLFSENWRSRLAGRNTLELPWPWRSVFHSVFTLAGAD